MPPRGGGRDFKDALYGQFARLGKALASPHRIELLDLLAQGERTVEALAGESALSVANASRHLQVLRAARLVDARKDGLYVRYRLSGDDVHALVRVLRSLAAERLGDVDRIVRDFLGDRAGAAPIAREDLLARARAGSVLVIDVRPALEFEAGHVAGAVSVPIAELERRLGTLPKGREIVAYCRGPYCVYADEAVALLRSKGLRARRLQDGFPEWAAAGLPVEAG